MLRTIERENTEGQRGIHFPIVSDCYLRLMPTIEIQERIGGLQLYGFPLTPVRW
jgi:hypothetical protein